MAIYRGPKLVFSRTVEIARQLRMGGCTAHLHQFHFQGFNDDGNETACTTIAAIDTNFSRDVDTIFGLRFEIEESANCSSMNNQFHLQHNINGAGYVDTTTTSSGVRLADSANLDGGNPGEVTTNRISGSARTFVAGAVEEDGTTPNVTLQNQHTEMHFVVELVGADLTDQDTITFRVITGASTLTEYHVTPTVTANKGAAPIDLDAQPGFYSLTGVAATTLYDRTIDAAAGAYSLTGVTATTLYDRAMNATAGVYNITGLAAGTLYNRVLLADPGTYTLTGVAATTEVVGGAIVDLTADPGSYVFSGLAAGTLYDRVLTADPGAYTLAGVAATLEELEIITLPADEATYALTGFAATLEIAGSGPPEAGRLKMLTRFTTVARIS